MNVVTPMIADSSSCPDSQELIRRAMRRMVTRRAPRASGGYTSRNRFRSRSASISMYATMNSTANTDAIAAAALRMYAKTCERGSSMPSRSSSRIVPTGTYFSAGVRMFVSISSGIRAPSSFVS
jgi:hypothetical protein